LRKKAFERRTVAEQKRGIICKSFSFTAHHVSTKLPFDEVVYVRQDLFLTLHYEE